MTTGLIFSMVAMTILVCYFSYVYQMRLHEHKLNLVDLCRSERAVIHEEITLKLLVNRYHKSEYKIPYKLDLQYLQEIEDQKDYISLLDREVNHHTSKVKYSQSLLNMVTTIGWYVCCVPFGSMVYFLLVG